MFTSDSRYFDLATTSFKLSDGKNIVYKKRRFFPNIETLEQIAEVTIKGGDRLDNITAQLLGNPLNYWQIADSNDILDPDTLTQEIGRTLKVASPNIGINNS